MALIGRHARRDHLHGRRLGPGQPAAPGRRSPRALTALLGDAVTVVDGVEVRHAAAGPPGFAHRPGRPARRACASHCSTRRRRRCCSRSTSRRRPRRVRRLRRRLRRAGRPGRADGPVGRAGPLELGVIGVGDWTVSAGDGRTELPSRPVAGDRRGDARAAARSWQARGRRWSSPIVRRRRERRPDGPGCRMRRSGWSPDRPAAPDDDGDRRAAVAAAATADVAVVVVGLTEEQETEARRQGHAARCPASRTRWSRRSPRPRARPSSWSTRPPRC